VKSKIFVNFSVVYMKWYFIMSMQHFIFYCRASTEDAKGRLVKLKASEK